MTDSVLVAEHPAGDRVIGQLTLNVEKTLNSLTREMVETITDRLEPGLMMTGSLRCSSMALEKRRFVLAVTCRHCATPASKPPVALASTPSIFSLASTA